jgi:hypothetical protein
MVILTLALLLAGCGAVDPFGDAEGKNIKRAVDALFADLERRDYPAAAGQWCELETTPPPQTAAELTGMVDDYPRPWKTKLVSAQYYTPEYTGSVNVTLTDADRGEHQYNVGIKKRDNWQVCDLSTGTVHIDAF